MTTREREVVAWHLDRIEGVLASPGVPPRVLQQAQTHLSVLRQILGGAHSAESHGARRRAKAAGPEGGSHGSQTGSATQPGS